MKSYNERMKAQGAKRSAKLARMVARGKTHQEIADALKISRPRVSFLIGRLAK